MEAQEYYVRRAHHAGSWYESSPTELDASLTGFLKNVDGSGELASGSLRSLVGPHAGYSYSGPTAAYAYAALIQEFKRRRKNTQSAMPTTLLVLHPSHHVYLDKCAVSGASQIETPLGNLQVDSDLRDRLLESKSPSFGMMDQETDQYEHSGELHYPFMVKACRDAGLDLENAVKTLPIMVGSMNSKQEEVYGKFLAPILAQDHVITIVSSDFCHWGSRFRYQPVGKEPIHEAIRILDHEGMKHMEMQQPGAFAKYLKETQNTICGRHPIGIWLHALSCNQQGGVETVQVKFLRYAQSSQATSMRDSSVSYASAVAMK
eukprot:CAMPEP_0116848246 /NCGR_PEP_ID=MMETSP0418-20121206/14887_1 /TAXON_ID=1158023 /ORGANISM="Astrosyne radiata, Strain 13vi08-1A" /LENGTH=317 /DNA_ID=CAMNT_0004479789 /DNA_START=73 /DNA_END=1026 /DNA_ORIENTATION=+